MNTGRTGERDCCAKLPAWCLRPGDPGVTLDFAPEIGVNVCALTTTCRTMVAWILIQATCTKIDESVVIGKLNQS